MKSGTACSWLLCIWSYKSSASDSHVLWLYIGYCPTKKGSSLICLSYHRIKICIACVICVLSPQSEIRMFSACMKLGVKVK